MSRHALQDWLRRNRPDLAKECRTLSRNDRARQILNAATGLMVAPTDAIDASCVRYLARLKEIAVTPPPGCTDNRKQGHVPSHV